MDNLLPSHRSPCGRYRRKSWIGVKRLCKIVKHLFCCEHKTSTTRNFKTRKQETLQGHKTSIKMPENVIEYGSKKSYLPKRRRSAQKVGSFRREVMDSVIDNVEANPLHRFSSAGDLIKEGTTKGSSSMTSFASPPASAGIKQNAKWGSSGNLTERIKLVDRGQLLVETDRQSSRLLGNSPWFFVASSCTLQFEHYI